MTQLQPSRCKLAEYQRAVFAINPEEDTPFDALLDPAYWAHVSNHFRIGCRVEIYPPDGSYYAELIVQDCGRLFAKMAVLRKVDLSRVEVGENEASEDYKLKYSGPHAQWCVIRLSDKEAIGKNLPTKEAAASWLAQHLKTVSGRVAA